MKYTVTRDGFEIASFNDSLDAIDYVNIKRQNSAHQWNVFDTKAWNAKTQDYYRFPVKVY